MRKGFLRVLSALCAAALLSSLCPALAADESAEDIGAQVEAYLAQYNLTGENITIGYRDLRSGEEYYYNGDAAFYGASLYKVALNMYYAREVARGSITWDTAYGGLPLRILLEGSLIDSNNDYSYKMVKALGGYARSRVAVAPFYGMSENGAQNDRLYTSDSWITARQMIHCLDLLYYNHEEFPRVLRCMLRADPDDYFRRDEDRWPIAQKYGYYFVRGYCVSAAGFVFTEAPFALVVMTKSTRDYKTRIAELCTMFAEYNCRANSLPLPEAPWTPEPEPGAGALLGAAASLNARRG